ncbi:conserved membrane protein of unknown function [Tenacibaculum sp. 190130A14a]|uniref:DUF4345 domain-containing protein n=1 Tax=Tenacibaculum polynesiense TaxID=3137857 RepID=A0ABM9PEN1_9FLAO
MEIVKTIILLLSGLMLLFVGLMRLTNPIKTYLKSSGIKLSNNVDLLNEVRGVSAVMFCAGIIILLGILIPKMSLTSFTVGTLIFSGFALGRVVSLLIDGKPNKQIMQGIMFEIVLGGANLFGIFSVLA